MVPLGNLNWMQWTVLFPGGYDVIFISFVVLGYIIEVRFPEAGE
jgi:hypothetical protein